MNEIIPVILAAGRGSRLGVEDLPKPMIPVTERPMIQDAVESLFKMGFGPSDIKTVIGYKGEVIKGYFGTDLEYYLQEILNGNAGALEAGVVNINNLETKHILAIQGDDAPQATRENMKHLIHTHLSRDADVTVLSVNKPDDSTHKMEYVYDNEA